MFIKVRLALCTLYLNLLNTPGLYLMECLFRGGLYLRKHDFSLYQVIFTNGEGALQVLPRLLDIIPEARLNLVCS